MKLTAKAKIIGLFAFGIFCGLASFWVPHVQQVWGRNMFLSVEPMLLLGLTILVSLAAVWILPDAVVRKSFYPLPARGIFHNFPHSFRWKVFVVGAGGLFLLTLILYFVNQRILHAFLSSADEHSCYFLAECLRKGKLYVPIPQFADFFKVVHVGMKGGKWFSVYPPGWPLIWSLGMQLRIVDWLNPIMSVLSVFFFYLSGIRLINRAVAVMGLTMMCLSPFFMFTAASYFSHGTCLLMISVFLYSFLRWREAYCEGRDPVGWAAVCAFAFGYGLLTRPLTIIAIAGPFLLAHFLPCIVNVRQVSWLFTAQWRQYFHFKVRRSDWIFIAIVAAFVPIMLYQNFVVTGKLFKAPLKYYQSWERLGFKKGHYTPVDGFFFVIARIFYLMDWFAPAFVAAYLFFLGGGLISFFKKQVSEPFTSRNLFCLSPVFLALAYFLYYSWGGNQWGPRYWWEAMPFLCMTVADWIVRYWESENFRVRKFLFALFVCSFIVSGVLFEKQAFFTAEASSQRRALYDLAEKTVQGPAVVFIRGFLGNKLVLAEDDAVRNSPFLDGKILYAHDLGQRNNELREHYRTRAFYSGGYDREKLQPRLEKLSAQ